MQKIVDLWQTTTGKIAILGGGGVIGLLSLCFICTICGVLFDRGDDRRVTKRETRTIVSFATENPTPEPTATLEPTFTPKPTATLIPLIDTPGVLTETSSTSKLQILSHSSYVDDIGWFNIVGEAQNNSDVPLELVEIGITLYDNTENVIGTDFTFVELDIIPPGGKSPFLFTISDEDQLQKINTYELSPEDDPIVADTLPTQNCVILTHNSLTKDDWLYVPGEVQNTGNIPVQFVKVIVTLYDATDNVVGTSSTYTEPDTISPSGIAPFEVVFTSYHPSFDHYAIQVQGAATDEIILMESPATEIPTEPPPATEVPTEPPPPTEVPTEPPPPTEVPTEPPPAITGGGLVIITLDKKAEYVDIQNTGSEPVDLSGWNLLSERGSQNCPLGGTIQPGEVLRIWAMAEASGEGGFNCEFDTNIWNNSEPDAAILYDPSGTEVSRME